MICVINLLGQLGLNHTMDVFVPTKLPIPENKMVIDIAAGKEHSLILIGMMKI